MSNLIESVRIRGFRSLANIEIKNLSMATVLIGPNGSGKSNFVRFFEMMSWMIGARRLGEFVQQQGGADDQLFGGSRESPLLEGELALRTDVGRNDYRFSLAYAHPDRFMFTDEALRFSRKGLGTEATWQHLGSGHTEARLVEVSEPAEVPEVSEKTARVLVSLLNQCAVYQFHDTSNDSKLKKNWDVEDNAYLRAHGGNLAAILYRLEHEDRQRLDTICGHIKRVVPGFDRFQIEESFGKALLRWKLRGMDKTIGAHLTSDGTLRFFALVTLLNLPTQMLPDVLLLDEPELGLHPAAVALVGDMIKVLTKERQVIVATQSPSLVDAFAIDEVIVLELQEGQTNACRFEENAFQDWLDDYTTGELWQKNLLGGRP